MRLTRLLPIYTILSLLLAAAGLGLQPARAGDVPQEVLVPAWSWEPGEGQQGAKAGQVVTGAGDVNGDGYADLLVGAPLYSGEVYRSGSAFLFRGTFNGLESTPYWTAGGEVQGNGFGESAASAGDVNCDGFDDVIIGAPNYDKNNGKVYVYHGSLNGLSQDPAWTYTGAVRDILLGFSVAGLGNVNKDTFNGKSCDDVIVGVRYFSDGQASEGAAFVFHGSPDGLSLEPDLILQENVAGAQLGFAVSAAGDLNKDGYADAAVGAPYLYETEKDQGGLFVYYGSASGLQLTPRWMVRGGLPGAKLGFSVSAAGDVNGDEYDDLAAGAPGWDDALGAVFVYYGSWSGPGPVADWSHFGAEVNIGYGEAVTGVGEVNGDEYDDLLVGVSRYSNDQGEEGAIYVHHGGKAGPAENPGWLAEGDKAVTDFGAWVAGAGDVNGDGLADLAVGAPLYKSILVVMGRAFVYHGFYQEVVDGVIVPRDRLYYLPVMIR